MMSSPMTSETAASPRRSRHTCTITMVTNPRSLPNSRSARPKPHESRVAPAARVALVVVHADERAARGTDHRTGALALEHPQELISPGEMQGDCRKGATGNRERRHSLLTPSDGPGDRRNRLSRTRHRPLRWGRGHPSRSSGETRIPAAPGPLPCPAIEGDVRDHRACGEAVAAWTASSMRRRWSASGRRIRRISTASTSAASKR